MCFTRVSAYGFCVVLGMAPKYRCFTRVSASIKTAFAFSLVWGHNACVSHASLYLFTSFFVSRYNACVSASVKTTSAFSLVWRYNACVSHACLHCLKRLLRFPWYVVKVYVFHTRLCIYLYGFRVFLGMAYNACVSHPLLYLLRRLLRCLVLHHNVCVSIACLHRLRRILRFSSYGVRMHAFHTLVCIY